MTTREAGPLGPPLSRRGAAALRYAALGWPVLPLHAPDPRGGCSCGSPTCAKPGKHPRSRRGLHDATTQAAQIAGWWTAWPDTNVGVVTGRLVVVDGNDGRAALAELEATYAPLPATFAATTGRGAHLYFIAEEERIVNSAGRLGVGLDVRGHGGYVIVPPSQHADGRPYRWTTRAPPAPMPLWLAALLPPRERPPAPASRAASLPGPRVGDRRARYFQAALGVELGDVASAAPGTRNDTLNRAAFRLAQLAASGHGDFEALAALLLDAALAAGLSEAEALATIHSALHAGQQHPRLTPLTP